ncbi:DNA polymerase III subunit delta [Nitrosomonas mobilis]|uniref:DNA polymerase III subunit delta n=1 Tax=Nitrosomonas mobilis TaxID=51642 RepID=A0A1G5SDV6_9PROT|nr:DNA polymerase III subunit delta [Nitrosomonas mobilis]SCZ84599.1 putative DNA polymerase III (Delta subunit) protein [Nitrosomonas mobilis]
MKFSPEQLSNQLKQAIAPLYVLMAGELLPAMEAADEIRLHAEKQGYIDREIISVDQHFDWSVLRQWGRQSSLFGNRRLLDIRIPTGKPGREGRTALEALSQRLPEEAITVISLPWLDQQSQNSKWFKALEQAGHLIVIPAIKREQLAAWIEKRLHRQNQSTDRDTLQFFADKIEGNILAAHQEIQKLALLYPPGKLTFEQIKTAILDVARYDVTQLAEAMINADIARFGHILSSLQVEGVASPYILAVLSEEIRLLLKLHTAIRIDRNVPLAQIMKTLRIWPSRQKLIATAFKRINLNLLIDALRQAANIDQIIKGMTTGDEWQELLNLGATLAATGKYHSLTMKL